MKAAYRRRLLLVWLMLVIVLANPLWAADDIGIGYIEDFGSPNRVYTRSDEPPQSPSSVPEEQYAIGYERVGQHGTSTYLGSGRWEYRSALGEVNTKNPNGADYLPYLWNFTGNRDVQFAGHVLEFYDWYTILDNSTGHTIVDDIRWVCQYWFEAESQWNTLDLYDHYYLDPVLNENNMSYGYRMTDGSSTMNVTYTFRNNDEVKTRIDFYADVSRRYRFTWQLTGMDATPYFLNDTIDSDGDGVNDTIGAMFQDEINFVWNDVNQTEMDCWYEWLVATKKLNVYIGNITVEAGNTLVIDPNIDVAADSDDCHWDDPYGTPVIDTTDTYLRFGNDSSGDYRAYVRFSVDVPRGSTILESDLYGYNLQDSASGREHSVYRVDETNVGDLEADATIPDVDKTPTVTFQSNGASFDWDDINVTEITAEQVSLNDWVAGYYIGFAIETYTYGASESFSWQDFSHVSSSECVLWVDYLVGDWYQARVAADSDDDYWEDPYGTPAHVTSGTQVWFYNDTDTSPYVTRGQARVVMDIPKGSTIHNATLYGHLINAQADANHSCYRIDETNVGSLEADSSMPTVSTTTVVEFETLNGDWGSFIDMNVTDLVQEQVNLNDWVAGYYIGFAFETPDEYSSGAFNFYDVSGGLNEIYLEVNYTVGDWYQARVAADSDDDYYQVPSTHYTAGTTALYGSSISESYFGQMRMQLTIPRNAIIHNATLLYYDTADDIATDGDYYLLNELNVGPLEDDTAPPTSTLGTEMTTDGATGWDSLNVTDMVQYQVNRTDWCSGFYIGFRLRCDFFSADQHSFEDYQHADDHPAYLEVNWTQGEWYQYPLGTERDDAYANYYGGGFVLDNSDTYVMFHKYDSSSIDYHGFLRFFVTFPTGLAVTNATLKVYEVNDFADTYYAWRIAGDNWNNAPENLDSRPELDSVGSVSFTSDGGGTEWVSWDISTLFNDFYEEAGYESFNCFGLELNRTTSNPSVYRIEDYSFPNYDRYSYIEIHSTGQAQEEYDYVDNNDSDVDSSSDIGTHSSFTDQQSAPDSTYDTLTEADVGDGFWNWNEDHYDQENTDIDSYGDYGTQTNPLYANDSLNSLYMNLQEWNMATSTNYQDWYKSYSTNIDSYADVGTETNPENAQDLGDADYMTLQEADQGGGGVDEDKYIDAYSDVDWSESGSSPYLDAQDDDAGHTGSYITVGGNGDVTGWCTFADTSGSGSGFTVILYVYHMSNGDGYPDWELDWTGDGTADASGSFTHQASYGWESAGTISGLDTDTEINACRLRLTNNKGGGGPDDTWVDAAYLDITQTGTTDYELDFEYQWTNANFSETNEEVCINVLAYQQTASETLKAWEWTGSAWASLGTFYQNGWNNFTASYLTSGTYYIKVNDTLQSDEAAQDTWSIDSIILHTWSTPTADYELDFEYQWTSAAYTESVANVSIYVQTADQTGGENLKAWEWDGADWVLLGTLTEDAWNNFTCTELSSGTYYIKLNDTDQASDTNQDSWNIDLITLSSWNTTNFRLDLEIQWELNEWDRVAEYICIYTGSLDAEDLEVYIWNTTSSAWDELWTDLSANQWNNYSVAGLEGWADSSLLTLRFLDDNQTNDGTSQDTWQIDSSLFRSYSGAEQSKTLYEAISIDETFSRIIDISRTFYESMTVAETVTNTANIILTLFEALAIAFAISTQKTAQKLLYESITVAEAVNNTLTASKTLFESISINESITNTLTGAKTLYESLTVNEVVTTQKMLYRTLYESITVDESVNTSFSATRDLFESITVNESITNTLTGAKTLYESLTVSESIDTAFGATRTLFESITVSEGIDTYLVIQKTLYEGITVNESIDTVFGAARTLYESITINETFASSFDAARTLFESITVSEGIDTYLVIQKTLYEGITVNESIDTVFGAARTLYESITINESITNTISLERTFFEAITVDESVNTSFDAARTLFESITVDEVVDKYIVIQKILYEGITVNESIDTAFSASKTLFESITVNESITNTISLERTFFEAITVDESVNTSFDAARTLFESITVDEVVDKYIVIQKILYEGITVNESIDTVFSASKTLFESITVNESIDTVFDAARTLYESITINESFASSFDAARTLFESITVSESIDTYLVIQKILYEGITVNESIDTVLSASKTLFESITVDESVTTSFGASRSLFESVSVNESIMNYTDYTRNLFESISINDSVTPTKIAGGVDEELYLFETITASESIDTILDATTTLFESISVNESITNTIDITKTLFESITVDESVTTSFGASRSLFESITVSESVDSYLVIQKILYEGITVNESVDTVLSATRSLFESISVSDTTTNTISIERSFFESITVNESVYRQVGRTFFESISIDEAITNQTVAVKTLFEAITVDESIDTVLSAYKTLFESITINDTLTPYGQHVQNLFEAISTDDTITRIVDYNRTFFETITTDEVIITTGIFGIAPVNVTAPYLVNPSDGDNMYGRYQFYLINSNFTDEDGYDSILYADLEIWNDAQDTLIWKARFNCTTDTFSIIQGSSYVTLLYSSYWESGDMLNITWSVKIEWAHADYDDLDARQLVFDNTDKNDTDWYEVDWDVVTSLDYSISPTLSDDRDDVGTTDLWLNGTVVYYGSSLHPLANETDVWVLHDVSGSWSDNIDGSGIFNVTGLTSSDSVRLNTYTVKIVGQGDGSGGTDLYYTTSFTDTFITDRVNITAFVVDEEEPELGQQVNFTITMQYEYDSTAVTTGTWTLNWSVSDYLNMLYVSGSDWNASDMSSSPTTRTYNYINGSETAYGITTINMNSFYVTVHWFMDYTVNITLWINDNYMMNGYNTTIHYTGLYLETGEVWNGTATFNTTDGSRFPLYWSYGNYTFNVTEITDPDYGAEQFQIVSDLPYCLFEQATYSQLAWEWNTQTGEGETGEDNDVFLYFYLGQLYWASNSTTIAEMTQIAIYMNDTLIDWGLVNAYGRIATAYPHLVAGGFNSTWDYVNISIYAVDCWLNGTQYNSLMWNTVLEVQHELDVTVDDPFIDAGAEAVIMNIEGQGNVILVAIYTQNATYLERAPEGVTVYLNVTSGDGTSYTVTRVTDVNGLVRWSINSTFADTLAGLANNFTLYYRTNSTSAWTEINRFSSITLTSPTINTEATETGIYIDIIPDYTIVSATQDFGEFAHIVGLENTYLIIIGAYDGTSTWNYTIISDLHRIFLPDILDEDTNYTITVRQALQANIIWAECTFTVEVEAKLFITERLFHVGSNELHLSGHVGVASQTALNASYSVYEDNFLIGSGTVLGDFDIFWDREVGDGDQNYAIKFTRGTQTTWVNGTYSKVGGALAVSVWDVEFDDAYINVFCTTSWGNATLYFYDNDTLMAWSDEAEVIQYRKQGGNGVHVVGVKIYGSADSIIWKNFTYSIAIIVADLQLTVFDWDTGSERLVSCTLETNWGNATVTLYQEGRGYLYSGVETGFGGISFYFEKSTPENTYIVVLYIDGGSQALNYTLGYSYTDYERQGGAVNNPTNQTIYDAVDQALSSNLAGQIVIPPAVFAGLLGLLVIAVAVIIGQGAWSKVKKSRKRKRESGVALAQAFLGGG